MWYLSNAPLSTVQFGIGDKICSFSDQITWKVVVIDRPVGTNLILVRWGNANINNLLSMKAERLTAWGPLGPLAGSRGRAPAGVQGAEPLEALGFSICKRPRKALLEIYFSLNQPRPACQWYRNVSIKWHSSLCIVNFRPSEGNCT